MILAMLCAVHDFLASKPIAQKANVSKNHDRYRSQGSRDIPASKVSQQIPKGETTNARATFLQKNRYAPEQLPARRVLGQARPRRAILSYPQTHFVTRAAERNGPMIFAQMGMLRAIHRYHKREFNPDRKDHHWGRRKLARDRSYRRIWLRDQRS